MPSFQLLSLPYHPFERLFALPDEQLAALNIERVQALDKPGFPCRVSLIDADVGEELLLLPFEHQPAASPYKSSGPIFVRRGADPARLAPDVVPDYVASRVMSLRAYDARHRMIAATVCEGGNAARELVQMLGEPEVEYIHLHNAKRGCYSCKAVRAADP